MTNDLMLALAPVFLGIVLIICMGVAVLFLGGYTYKISTDVFKIRPTIANFFAVLVFIPPLVFLFPIYCLVAFFKRLPRFWRNATKLFVVKRLVVRIVMLVVGLVIGNGILLGACSAAVHNGFSAEKWTKPQEFPHRDIRENEPPAWVLMPTMYSFGLLLVGLLIGPIGIIDEPHIAKKPLEKVWPNVS